MADKAVSAGERSSVEMDNVRIHTVGIGIASKDSSRVLPAMQKLIRTITLKKAPPPKK